MFVECLKNSRFDVAVRNSQSIPTRLNVFVCIFRTRVSKICQRQTGSMLSVTLVGVSSPTQVGLYCATLKVVTVCDTEGGG